MGHANMDSNCEEKIPWPVPLGCKHGCVCVHDKQIINFIIRASS